jgi:hypothetical protein
MYNTLLANGYPASNIFVLYGDGNDFSPPNQAYQSATTITKYSASSANVQNIFTWLANGNPTEHIPQMTNQDVLFLWTFGHGANAGTSTYADIKLWPGVYMHDTTFARYVDQVQYKKRIIFMQQCRAAGFIPCLQNAKTVMMTASQPLHDAYVADDCLPDGTDQTENEVYAGSYYTHGEFDYHLLNALGQKTLFGGSSVSSDANHDGDVSIDEVKAWEFAHDSEWNPWNVIPQYSDLGNIGPSTYLKISRDIQVPVQGAITQNTTWSNSIRIVNNVTVQSGVTLTILANTKVFVENGKALTVNGTLNAIGTSSQPITFTSSSANPTKGI